MNLKLHNKFEITKNGETIVAYNTLLRGVFAKIAGLEEYTSRLAVGTGSEQIDFDSTKMSKFSQSFETITEDICSDITQEKLYIKKLVSFDESDQTTFSFCELGLCSDSGDNPDIYNHVLLKNSEGQVVTVTKNPGDILQIRVTIYLELDVSATALFCKGENIFIKQLLGEDLGITDKKLYVTRGDETYENSYNYTHIPVSFIYSECTECDLSVEESEDGCFSLKFTAMLGSGEIEELLIFYGAELCMRQNVLDILPAITVTETFTPASGIVPLGKHIKSVDKVVAGETDITNQIRVVKYGTSLKNTVESSLWGKPSISFRTSHCENHKFLAYSDVDNAKIHTYKYEYGKFVEFNNSLDGAKLRDIVFFKDKLALVYFQSPYIRIYDFDGKSFNEKQVNLSNFEALSFKYKWLQAGVIMNENGEFIIAVIDEANNPFAIKLTLNEDGVYTDQVIRTNYDKAYKLFIFHNGEYKEPMFLFFVSTYQGETFYGCEKLDQYGNLSYFASSTEAYAVCNNYYVADAGGNIVGVGKSNNQEAKILYLPNLELETTQLPETEHIFIAQNASTVTFLTQFKKLRIFAYEGKGKFVEFDDNTYNMFDTFYVDGVFVFQDKLFTINYSNSEYNNIYTIKQDRTRIDFAEYDSVDVTYTKYNLLGSDPAEGVKLELVFTFDTSGKA